MNPFWRAYFSKGLVQPPTRYSALFMFTLRIMGISKLIVLEIQTNPPKKRVCTPYAPWDWNIYISPTLGLHHLTSMVNVGKYTYHMEHMGFIWGHLGPGEHGSFQFPMSSRGDSTQRAGCNGWMAHGFGSEWKPQDGCGCCFGDQWSLSALRYVHGSHFATLKVLLEKGSWKHMGVMAWNTIMEKGVPFSSMQFILLQLNILWYVVTRWNRLQSL